MKKYLPLLILIAIVIVLIIAFGGKEHQWSKFTGQSRSAANITDTKVNSMSIVGKDSFGKPIQMGNTPARINRRTGERFLNEDILPHLPAAYRDFVMYHEEGHYVLNTKSELEADAYAFRKCAQKGHRLSECILALTRTLNEQNPEHRARVFAMDKLAREFDYKKNGNHKAVA